MIINLTNMQLGGGGVPLLRYIRCDLVNIHNRHLRLTGGSKNPGGWAGHAHKFYLVGWIGTALLEVRLAG